MYNKLLSNNNNDEIVIKLDTDGLEQSLYYRDEGNMNIVVSLFAQENDDKRVIRFKKILADDEQSKCADHKNELTSFIHFEELLLKYFENADHFTVVPKIVFLDVDVHALNNFLMRDRPVVRRNKVVGNNYGLLYRDVAFLPKQIYMGKTINGEFKDSPTICIEIKAKQGYAMDDDDGKFDVKKCRFCYFQYLKLKNERIKCVSSYCPIDLFSGEADSMNRAIRGLMDNPQNNLKVFQDGKMIYNEYSKDKNALRRVFSNLFTDTMSDAKQEILFVNLIRKILLKDFKNCDNIADISSVYCDAGSIHTRNCAHSASAELPRNCILASILNTQLLVDRNFSNMEALNKLKEPISYDKANQMTLQDYKIGSTALDCSIMVTLRRINRNFDVRENVIDKNHYVTMKGSLEAPHHFIANATIVDLDMKKDSIAHFRKYKKQYMESKRAYFDFMENRKIEFHDSREGK